jgi:hypothetical protein
MVIEAIIYIYQTRGEHDNFVHSFFFQTFRPIVQPTKKTVEQTVKIDVAED